MADKINKNGLTESIPDRKPPERPAFDSATICPGLEGFDNDRRLYVKNSMPPVPNKNRDDNNKEDK